MDSIVTSFILGFVAIAFVATIISGLLKLIFFFKQKDSYRHILKFGLLGEVIGLAIMFGVQLFYPKEIKNREAWESIIDIPFYLMLIGQVIGVIMTFRKKFKA